jgi:DNA-directed RNA polymerase subunit RPC12/RpoP
MKARKAPPKTSANKKDAYVCSHCGEEHDPKELKGLEETWQQWKCLACGKWNDKKL